MEPICILFALEFEKRREGYYNTSTYLPSLARVLRGSDRCVTTPSRRRCHLRIGGRWEQCMYSSFVNKQQKGSYVTGFSNKTPSGKEAVTESYHQV